MGEQISLDLKEEALAKQFTVERYSFDEFMKKCELFEKSEQESWIFVLVVSSTGEGEPPDNAKRFHRDMRKKVDLIKKDPWLS